MIMQIVKSQINKLRLLRESLLNAAARLKNGRAVIKQFGREAYENERLKTALEEYTESCNAFAQGAAFAAAFYVLSAFLSLTAAVIAAGIAVLDGNINETAAVIITVLVFAVFAVFGVLAVIWLIKQFKQSDKPEASPDTDKTAPITYGDITEATERNDLNFSAVSFSYTDREIFSGLSFYVKSGESFAVLGRTGAGKTTFERILTRELTPDAGIITIGGIETADFTEELLKKRLKTLDFITSNRVSEVMNRDNIILLDGGVVSDSGTHQKLLVSSSLYRKMYEAEFGVNPYKSMDKGENFDDFL
jgi:ABC-type transport system involved in cytochrome bd biosynthesis fused ATPase/permease subunit